MQTSKESWQQAVESTFSLYKEPLDSPTRPEPIPLDPAGGSLVSVGESHVHDDVLIAALARWRRQNMRWYPTQFPVTHEGTARWLRESVLDIRDRIMFLVVSAQGGAVGHLGFAHGFNDRRELKVDNVMRGDHSSEPGIMSRALRAMLSWAEERLGPERIHLPVFADNEHAICFYRRLGFQEAGLTPLRRHEQGERVWYQPTAEGDGRTPDRYHLRLIYVPRSCQSGAA